MNAEMNLETGFPTSAPNALDIGIFRNKVSLRIGWDGKDGPDSYEGLLDADTARALAKQLVIAAAVAESK